MLKTTKYIGFSFLILLTHQAFCQQFNNRLPSQGGMQIAISIEKANNDFLVFGTAIGSFSNQNMGLLNFKIDSSGQVLSRKAILSSIVSRPLTSPMATDPTFDGGFIAGGAYKTSRFDSEGYLIKYKVNGDTLWTRRFDPIGGEHIEFFQARQTSDNGFVAIGTITDPNRTSTNVDGYLLKTDSSGNGIFAKTFSTGLHNFYYRNILETNDHGFIVSGSKGAYTAPNHINYQPTVVKLDSFGNVIWTYTKASPFNDPFANAIQTMDGNYLFSSGNYRIIGSDTLMKPSLVKLSPTGALIWTKEFGNLSKETVLLGLKELPDSSIIMSGYNQSMAQAQYKRNGILIYAKPNGDEIFSTLYQYYPNNNTEASALYDVISIGKEGFIAVGSVNASTLPSTHQSAWFIRVDTLGCISNSCAVSLDEIKNDEFELDLYPNPSNGKLFVKSRRKVDQINVFSTNGQLIESHSGHLSQLDLPTISGMYLLELKLENGQIERRKILRR